MNDLPIIIILIITTILSWLYVILKSKQLNKNLSLKEKEMDHKMYELAILKELGDRAGYSLDVKQIIDIITGSLHQFIEYSAVSYMLLEPEKIIFRVHLEKSVNRKFIDDVKNRMAGSLSALLDKDLGKSQVEEVLSGAILTEEIEGPVLSFFNIPLVIGGKVVGILTVAHTEAGLYKEDEMTILYKITNQASQAVTRLQEVVSTEQRKLNAMVESMDDGVVMTDTDYRILVINPSAKKAVGLSEEKKDITIFDLIENLGEQFNIREHLEESIKLKKNYISEKILLKDRFKQIFVFPVKNISTITKQEDILGGVVIFHDITKEIELEKIKKDFTSMLVHELRSPLDGIKRISDLLKAKTIETNSAKYDEYLQMIFQNSSSMLNMVTDILDVAKLEAGKFVTKKQPSNIIEIIKNRIDFYEISAKDTGIKIEFLSAKNVPSIANFDPEGIKHVLNNLLSNALKFTKPGGEIKITALYHNKGENIKTELEAINTTLLSEILLKKEDTESLIILISDTGIGIRKEQINNIFNKFKQVENDMALQNEKKGTGLGLVISKGIIEGHNGEIGVVSEYEKGSTFFFTIPLV